MTGSTMRAIAAAAVVAATASAADGAGRWTGRQVPDFTATDVRSGRTVSLSSLRGHVVLLDFWATWCAPCRAEIPNIKAMHDKYGPGGLQIVSVSLDRSEDRLKSYIERSGLEWHHVYDARQPISRQYGIGPIPRMLVLDAQGTCVADGVRGPTLERAIRRALGGDGPDPARPPVVVRRSQGLFDPPTQRELLDELDRASAQIDGITEPWQAPCRRLEAVAGTLRRIEPLLATEQGAARAASVVDRVRPQLVEARHALFMEGLDEPVAIGGPATGAALADRLAYLQLVAGRLADSCGQAHAELARLRISMNALRLEVERGSTEPVKLRARIDEVRDEALGFCARWCEPWIEQLDAVDRIIGAWRRGGGEADVLAAEAQAIRRELAERLAGGGSLEELEGRFGELARKVLALMDMQSVG